MGVDVQLETESGEVVQFVGDDQGIFLRTALDGRLNSGKTCLRFIDPFGNTIFNFNQWPVVMEELEFINQHSTDNDLKEYARKVLKLLSDSRNKRHHYLKFVGD